jgi:hypothetical protein
MYDMGEKDDLPDNYQWTGSAVPDHRDNRRRGRLRNADGHGDCCGYRNGNGDPDRNCNGESHAHFDL